MHEKVFIVGITYLLLSLSNAKEENKPSGNSKTFRKDVPSEPNFVVEDEISTGVFGGKQAKFGEFPWVVRLLVFSNGNSGLCGGMLIKPEWVLSAAHCFHGEKIDKVEVQFRREVTKKHHYSQTVSGDEKHVHIHGNYDPTNIINDIALIKLDNTDHGITVFPRLAKKQSKDILNSKFIVAGWGLTEKTDQNGNHIPSKRLLKAQLKFEGNKKCNEKGGRNWVMAPHNFCAVGIKSNIDACQGDSGGPLFIEHPETKSHEIIGLVSYGPSNCASNVPGVYTNVAKYKNWLARKTKSRKSSGKKSSRNSQLNYENPGFVAMEDEPEIVLKSTQQSSLSVRSSTSLFFLVASSIVVLFLTAE